MGGVKNRMKAFLNKILLQIWNAEDEGKKIFIDSEELGKPIGNGEKYYHWVEKQRALPEEKPSDWLVTQKEIFMSLCNDNSLLFRWMHLLFPICQDRKNLMIRYVQHSHLFICSQQE